MRKEVNEKFAFDFPYIKENEHLFASRIDWEAEEKRLSEQEKETDHKVNKD